MTQWTRRVALAAGAMLLVACSPTIQGVVVFPDGSPLGQRAVRVYTQPATDSVLVKADGSFQIGKNVAPDTLYTLVAEDPEGASGFVRGYKWGKEKVVIKLSREVNASEAVLEGDLQSGNGDLGPGDKIFKSSQ